MFAKTNPSDEPIATPEHIIDKLKGSRATKISKVAESIKNNIENGGKMWEVKRNLKRKNKIHTKF